ncbi:hypothetical protein [Nitrincola iocasae]|uniref:Uncharacterized protein n=1 Tax=Nitrincola iocasae TaxID=2614693 RepID=A0A5J6L9U8_9GAMM|nr:hypothetical protein [Nitrincola iocasae]QEW05275.1 hypothetical protein F5I99_01515 [Nitrincola iocasae]
MIGTLSGGILVTTLFSIVQVMLDKKRYDEIDKYNKLKVKKIIDQRDDKSYYENLISNCTHKLHIMGVSCNRFIADFADPESRDHVLIDILKRNTELNVKFLVANYEHAPTDIQNNFHEIKRKMEELKKQYPEQFDYKYYNHNPSHSYFRIDSDVLVGPHFEKISSKNSPAIHLDINSSYVSKYISYFDDEWELAKHG